MKTLRINKRQVIIFSNFVILFILIILNYSNNFILILQALLMFLFLIVGLFLREKTSITYKAKYLILLITFILMISLSIVKYFL
jgi:asparagine N-glycosylation enzyme membrane subunit Stt3